jgi:hypothetical protein
MECRVLAILSPTSIRVVVKFVTATPQGPHKFALMVRTALYEAANVLLSRITRFSKLKRWGIDVAKRRGSKRAKVPLARKIGIILHRMWIDGTTYRWAEAKPIAAQA